MITTTLQQPAVTVIITTVYPCNTADTYGYDTSSYGYDEFEYGYAIEDIKEGRLTVNVE